MPWVALLALAVGLEAAGLALGGRSTTVPTVSTVIDRTMVWHISRFVLFAAWLAVAWVPFVRSRGWGSADPTPRSGR
jgi:hypothetical protein